MFVLLRAALLFTCTHFWCFSFLSPFPCLSPPHFPPHYGLHYLSISRISPSDLNWSLSFGFTWCLSLFSLSDSHTPLSPILSAYLPLFFHPPTFWTVPSAAVAVLHSAARHPTFSSSSHFIAGCCGCEEGRGSDSEMCHFAESKAVSGTCSAVQVQVNGMLLAHLILLTTGINWPFEYNLRNKLSNFSLKWLQSNG